MKVVVTCRPTDLWKLLVHYKLYPIARIEHLLMSKAYNSRNYLSRLHRHAQYLAEVIDEMRPAWEHRLDADNQLPHQFDAMVTGSIDTFPIYIQTPPQEHRKLHYNGSKYKSFVLKVPTWIDL
jgi:hypothetical protein